MFDVPSSKGYPLSKEVTSRNLKTLTIQRTLFSLNILCRPLQVRVIISGKIHSSKVYSPETLDGSCILTSFQSTTYATSWGG